MGLQLSCTKVSEASLVQPKLHPNDIEGFYDALKSNPVFNDRFKNVPLLKVLSMANEVLFFLMNASKEQSVASFKEIFDMHALMYISEAEIDTFFKLFIKHCHIQSEVCLDLFQPGITYIKNMILNKEKLKHIRFYKEIKRNPILHKYFKTTSPYCLSKMVDEIFRLLEVRISDEELESIWDIHRMLNITVQDYDEFIDLFFEIWCPDIYYRTKAGPIFLKMKNVMIGKPLQRVVSFRKALEYPIEGRRFHIPEKKLGKMCSQMVDVVLNPKCQDFNSIAISHKYMNITGRQFDELIRRFLETYNLNDSLVWKGKRRLSKLREIMACD